MYKSIVLIASLSFSSSLVFAEDIQTRFGLLKISDENTILYENKALSPEIQGNSSLSLIGTYQFKNSDVVLIQDNGGSACPAQFYFVTTSTAGVKSTPAFGTCSDLIDAKQVDDSISVTMPGFVGPFESEDAQIKAGKEKHVYLLKGEVFTEDGKPVK